MGLTAGHTDISLWYVVSAKRDQELSYDAQEFREVKWFEFSEVPVDRGDPNLGRFRGKLRSKRPLGKTRDR